MNAGRTKTFLGERYRRLARRRGKKRAIVAIGRSVLVIIWHLLQDPEARFHGLGPGHFSYRVNPDASKRNHLRQLEAPGYTVTSDPVPLRPTGRATLPTPHTSHLIFGLVI